MADSGQDLVNALKAERELLKACVKTMKEVGRNLAMAESEYRIALRIEILRLHIEDGVAWTVCDSLAKGKKDVAKLRFNRDIKKSDYDVIKEKINQTKIEVKIADAEIKQDWGKHDHN